MSVFGRTDFSRIFIFRPPDFFADFVAGFFLLIFAGKKWPKKSSRKIPGKILQKLYDKNPRHISAEGLGQFRTKNAIALKIVVKYYRGSILLSVPIRCHFSQEKEHPNCYRDSELLYRGSELPSR